MGGRSGWLCRKEKKRCKMGMEKKEYLKKKLSLIGLAWYCDSKLLIFRMSAQAWEYWPVTLFAVL